MPWRRGTTPLAIEVCAGNVTDGNTDKAPALLAPPAASRRSTGTFKPCASGLRYAPGIRPSMVTTITCWIGPGGSAPRAAPDVAAPAGDAGDAAGAHAANVAPAATASARRLETRGIVGAITAMSRPRAAAVKRRRCLPRVPQIQALIA